MNINQKYIDLHLLCCSGYGNVDYAYEDCKIIQRAIQDGFGEMDFSDLFMQLKKIQLENC